MPSPDYRLLFASMTQDAVLWKSSRLYKNAIEPDEQAGAMEQLVAMLLCIANETKRNAYVKQVCEVVGKDAKLRNEEYERLTKRLGQLQKNVAKVKSKSPEYGEAQPWVELEEQCAAIEKQLLELRTISGVGLAEKEVKKQVADALKKKLKDAEAVKMKAQFEQQFQNATNAGLPEDFKGTRQDIFDALKYGIYVHEDVYYSRGSKGSDYPISNFTMRILYHVDTSDEQAFRLIAVKNVYGFEVVINLNTDDFVALGSFKKVLARRGDFVFKGADSDLTRLQEFLQKDEVKTVYVKTLGYHMRGNFWCWANGVMPLEKNEEGKLQFMPVDEYGIVRYMDKNYFIPACSKMYAEKDEQFVNEKKFIYLEPAASTPDFKLWSELMYKAYGKKSIAAILFYIGSLFRDITMKQIQRYPILNLFGPPGAGKGTMAESIMCMFGERQDQIMLGGASTVVGFMRKFAQFRNSIVWLDEYKNNLPVKFIESFKNIYDGKGYERGKMTNDFSTESTPIHSSCILSGQDMPTQEPALFMRCIMVAFEQGKFTDDQRESFKQLTDMERNGLSFITADIFRYRNIIQEKFREKFAIIQKQTIKDVANVEVDDRMINNIAILLTYMFLLNDVLQFPFRYNEAKAFLIDNMILQHGILAGNNDVSKFWGVVESMFYMDIVHEDKDFMLEDGYIYLRLMQVHPLYVKELKNRGDMNFLSKSTLEHYLKLDNTVYVDYVRKRFKDGSNNWCYKMKYNKLGIDLIKLKHGDVLNDDQKEKALDLKYKEMGVHVNGSTVAVMREGVETDLPF